ncbi:hypothetical protein HK099_003745 [Clydaea vesicula]|uniref:Adhesin domain-containing protein n=1 Tax=Clydaea vesicula TaxID=447962 RepID=A0AAD5XYQ9_9FUNG|nr:hypothetical protein HK099_003745 [Clydaea vesicula]
MEHDKLKAELERNSDARARFLIDSEIIDKEEQKSFREKVKFSIGTLGALVLLYVIARMYFYPATERDLVKYPQRLLQDEYDRNIEPNLPNMPQYLKNSHFGWLKGKSRDEDRDRTEINFENFRPDENFKMNEKIKEVIVDYNGYTVKEDIEGLLNLVVQDDEKVSLEIDYRLSSKNSKKLIKDMSFKQKKDGDAYIIEINVPRKDELDVSGCIIDPEHDYGKLRKYYKRKGHDCETILVDMTLKLIKVEKLTKIISNSRISILRLESLESGEIRSVKNILLVDCKFEKLRVRSQYGLIYGNLEIEKDLEVLAEFGDINISRLKFSKHAKVSIKRLSQLPGDVTVGLEHFKGSFLIDTKLGEVSLLGDNFRVTKNIEKGGIVRERIVEGTIAKGKEDQLLNVKSNHGDVVLVLLDWDEKL